jgi:hypothetical protein
LSDYDIKILPTHNEVRLRGRVDRRLVGSILEELKDSEGFPDRNAIWILEDTIEPPSFDEFESIAVEVKRYLPTARVDKRVGLVGSFGTVSSMLELWRASATDLPFKMEIFQDYENAVHWVT